MSPQLRLLVRDRADNRCEYCRLRQEHLPFVTFQIEHIRARQHGGLNDETNLALACDRCNAHKGPNLSGIDPETDEMVELFNPREQAWEEHFERQGMLLVGRTSIGRATVQVLNMNEPRRVQLRQELLKEGVLDE